MCMLCRLNLNRAHNFGELLPESMNDDPTTPPASESSHSRATADDITLLPKWLQLPENWSNKHESHVHGLSERHCPFVLKLQLYTPGAKPIQLQPLPMKPSVIRKQLSPSWCSCTTTERLCNDEVFRTWTYSTTLTQNTLLLPHLEPIHLLKITHPLSKTEQPTLKMDWILVKSHEPTDKNQTPTSR